MNCDGVRSRLPEYWSAQLDDGTRLELAEHLDGCVACRREAESLGAIWANLGLVPAEQPGRELRVRFYEALDAYRQGMAAAERSPWPPLRTIFERCWPKRPALQFGVSVALLVVGLGIGYSLHDGGRPRDAGDAGEVAHLRGEVDNMRQLVALSLLRQPSPSDRLKGVDWSYRVPQSDTEVLAALLYTINHDENENVRLAAVDALHYFADSPVARRGMLQAIPKQSSPLVKIALIDLTVDLRDRQSLPVLETLARGGGASPEVGERARWAIERLK